MVYCQLDFGTQGVSLRTKADDEEAKIIALFTSIGILLICTVIMKVISENRSKFLS